MKSEARAKELDEQGAISPVIFSPLKVKHNRPVRHAEFMRKLSIVDFESSDDSEEYSGDEMRNVKKETNYLPLPRSKANPNAKGGSIKVEPIAPNQRLD